MEKTTLLRSLVMTMFLAFGAWAQRIRNMDIFFTSKRGISRNQAHQEIADDTDPEVHGQSPIDAIKLVLPTLRKVPVNSVVDRVAHQDGN